LLNPLNFIDGDTGYLLPPASCLLPPAFCLLPSQTLNSYQFIIMESVAYILILTLALGVLFFAIAFREPPRFERKEKR
jgi:photosystem II PsbT protein